MAHPGVPEALRTHAQPGARPRQVIVGLVRGQRAHPVPPSTWRPLRCQPGELKKGSRPTSSVKDKEKKIDFTK